MKVILGLILCCIAGALAGFDGKSLVATGAVVIGQVGMILIVT